MFVYIFNCINHVCLHLPHIGRLVKGWSDISQKARPIARISTWQGERVINRYMPREYGIIFVKNMGGNP